MKHDFKVGDIVREREERYTARTRNRLAGHLATGNPTGHYPPHFEKRQMYVIIETHTLGLPACATSASSKYTVYDVVNNMLLKGVTNWNPVELRRFSLLNYEIVS